MGRGNCLRSRLLKWFQDWSQGLGWFKTQEHKGHFEWRRDTILVPLNKGSTQYVWYSARHESFQKRGEAFSCSTPTWSTKSILSLFNTSSTCQKILPMTSKATRLTWTMTMKMMWQLFRSPNNLKWHKQFHSGVVDDWIKWAVLNRKPYRPVCIWAGLLWVFWNS